jgi:hypothetical protein
MGQLNNFYKNNPSDEIWWVDNRDTIGEWLFSFDKKEVFNLFADYPHKLTAEQKKIFDKENPYWADFFKDR